MLTIHRTHLHRGSSRHRAVDARRIRSPPLAVLACQAQARKRQTVGFLEAQSSKTLQNPPPNTVIEQNTHSPSFWWNILQIKLSKLSLPQLTLAHNAPEVGWRLSSPGVVLNRSVTTIPTIGQAQRRADAEGSFLFLVSIFPFYNYATGW